MYSGNEKKSIIAVVMCRYGEKQGEDMPMDIKRRKA
jgi:hypothetical protein